MANKSPMRGASPKASETGAQYEVLKTSLIHGHVYNKGETVRYGGIPGQFLKPLDGEGKAIADKAKAIREAKYEGETAEVRGEARNLALKAYSDELLGIADGGVNDNEPPENQKELLAQAEQTRKDTLAQSQESGGVLVQMTGVAPETVIPTTGVGAEANTQQQKSAAEQKKGR